MNNNKIFTLYIKRREFFKIFVDSFSTTTTFILRLIIPKPIITAFVSLRNRIIVNLRIRRIRFIIDNNLIKLATGIIFNLNIIAPRIRAISSMIQRSLPLEIKLGGVDIGFVSRLTQRFVNTTIEISRIRFSLNPMLVQLIPLYVHDPILLSNLDSMPLSQMDYVNIT